MDNCTAERLSRFFEDLVQPALEEFSSATNAYVALRKGDDAERIEQGRILLLRRARIAAIELHQFSDQVAAEKPDWNNGAQLMRVRAVRDWLTSEIPPADETSVSMVAVLHDVADAFKHARLTISPEKRLIHGSIDIRIEGTGWGRGGFGNGPWGGAPSVIIVTKDGRTFHLSSALRAVGSFWKRFLKAKIQAG